MESRRLGTSAARSKDPAAATHGRRSAQDDAQAPGAADSNGIGSMGIFTVLSEANMQLDNVADLDTLLKVAVGVIKDLTQFHRVMVYQFDTNWNGQVRFA